jgi:hypothetical protein
MRFAAGGTPPLGGDEAPRSGFEGGTIPRSGHIPSNFTLSRSIPFHGTKSRGGLLLFLWYLFPQIEKKSRPSRTTPSIINFFNGLQDGQESRLPSTDRTKLSVLLSGSHAQRAWRLHAMVVGPLIVQNKSRHKYRAGFSSARASVLAVMRQRFDTPLPRYGV